jgi:hypothetical protein
MGEDRMMQKNVWSYSDKPGKAAVAAAGMIVTILLAVMLFSHGFTMGSYTVLLPGMLAAWSLFRMLRSTTIELDLDKGTVRKKERFWFSEK